VQRIAVGLVHDAVEQPVAPTIAETVRSSEWKFRPLTVSTVPPVAGAFWYADWTFELPARVNEVMTGPSNVNDRSRVLTKLLMVRLKSAAKSLDRAGAAGVTTEREVAVLQVAVAKIRALSPHVRPTDVV